MSNNANRIASAIMKAIVDASAIEGDGGSVLRAADTAHALTIVLAVFLEPAPPCGTAKGIRETSDAFARDLKRRIGELRTIYEMTGRRALDAVMIMPS